MFALHTECVFASCGFGASLLTAFFAIFMNIRKVIAFNLGEKLPQSSCVFEHFCRSLQIEQEDYYLGQKIMSPKHRGTEIRSNCNVIF